MNNTEQYPDQNAPEGFKENIRQLLLETVKNYLYFEKPFVIVIKNYNDWDIPLPKPIQKMNEFHILIDTGTLKNSFVEDGNDIVIQASFEDSNGEEIYKKTLNGKDIMGILTTDNRIIFIKTFKEQDEMKIPNTNYQNLVIDNEGVEKSMKLMLEQNPHLKK